MDHVLLLRAESVLAEARRLEASLRATRDVHYEIAAGSRLRTLWPGSFCAAKGLQPRWTWSGYLPGKNSTRGGDR